MKNFTRAVSFILFLAGLFVPAQAQPGKLAQSALKTLSKPTSIKPRVLYKSAELVGPYQKAVIDNILSTYKNPPAAPLAVTKPVVPVKPIAPAQLELPKQAAVSDKIGTQELDALLAWRKEHPGQWPTDNPKDPAERNLFFKLIPLTFGYRAQTDVPPAIQKILDERAAYESEFVAATSVQLKKTVAQREREMDKRNSDLIKNELLLADLLEWRKEHPGKWPSQYVEDEAVLYDRIKRLFHRYRNEEELPQAVQKIMDEKAKHEAESLAAISGQLQCRMASRKSSSQGVTTMKSENILRVLKSWRKEHPGKWPGQNARDIAERTLYKEIQKLFEHHRDDKIIPLGVQGIVREQAKYQTERMAAQAKSSSEPLTQQPGREALVTMASAWREDLPLLSPAQRDAVESAFEYADKNFFTQPQDGTWELANENWNYAEEFQYQLDIELNNRNLTLSEQMWQTLLGDRKKIPPVAAVLQLTSLKAFLATHNGQLPQPEALGEDERILAKDIKTLATRAERAIKKGEQPDKVSLTVFELVQKYTVD